MFMPSARVWNEMKYEPVGFWPVPINRGDEYALLLKAPLHVIKAAYRSCPVSLSVATAPTSAGTVVSTVLRIDDDPDSPLTVTGVHRYAEEQKALGRIFETGTALFVFFDELNRPVARATCALDSESCIAAHSLLSGATHPYVGEWVPTLGDVLDEIQGAIDPALAVPAKHSPVIVDVRLVLSEFQTIRITAIGEHEARDFRLEDIDEGYVQEHATWHLLENLFGKNVFHSPIVLEGTKPRELTDILGYCDAGVCFVESKATGVLAADPIRTSDRRAKNIQKQIDKGLSQLPGAMRSVQAGLSLTSKAGNPITIPVAASEMRHGIIMVSELFPSVDWTSVAEKLLKGSRETGAMLHVLDLRELRLLVGVSEDNPVHFIVHLTHRFETMCEHKSAFIRMRLGGPPLP